MIRYHIIKGVPIKNKTDAPFYTVKQKVIKPFNLCDKDYCNLENSCLDMGPWGASNCFDGNGNKGSCTWTKR